MEKSEINDETIMPDGRPFFAWKNELEMLRAEGRGVEQAKREFAWKMTALGVYEIALRDEPQTGDILIRVRRVDAILRNNPLEAIEKGEVTKL